MSKRTDVELLSDIKVAASRIISYVKSAGYESFMKDTKTQDAVIRNLEIIGEAVKNLSRSFKDQYPQIRWRGIARLRDKLIHHYSGVNLEILWQIIEESLPELLDQLNKILRNGKI